MHAIHKLPNNINVAIFGLGYVGLPLAVEFGNAIPTVGFDINETRIKELKLGKDHTQEVSENKIKESRYLKFTADLSSIASSNFYIVCVPTPVDEANYPDLTNLKSATKMVGTILKIGDIVVFESTVYPGCTEEICIPILEEASSLVYNKDFFCGYSPERINPGDKLHRIDNVIKVTSGSNSQTAEIVDNTYKIVAKGGTYKAQSIKVAEAAKVIENAQRDLNIAYMNELSIIFRLMNIDTEEVLSAARTKWNFIDFKPGLVGGHCIGVDPYYLTYKSIELGYNPRLLLAGRNLNDGMGEYICTAILQELKNKGINTFDSNILIMGYTFKENCPDVRNTKVKDIVDILLNSGGKVRIYDPIATLNDVNQHHRDLFIHELSSDYYDCVVVAVAHNEFKLMPDNKTSELRKNCSIFIDLKGLYPKDFSDFRL